MKKEQPLVQVQQKGGSLAGHGVVQLTETPGTIVFYVIIGIAGIACYYICSPFIEIHLRLLL